MSWSGGTYTKGNSGTGGWAGDASLGIGIEAGRHDTQDDDFATGINQCLNKDGSNSATADLNMGSHKHLSVANATARNNYAAAGQVQDSAFIWCGTSAGSANAQTLSPTPAITAYAAGQVFRFIAGFTPTSTLTIAVSGLAAKSVLAEQIGTAVGNLAVFAGMICEVIYDGTSFVLRNGFGSNIQLADFAVGGSARALQFFKSRGASYPTNAIVAADDAFGIINFWGANGTGYDRPAYIAAFVDGTPGGSNDMPARITFATAPDTSASAVERMRINRDGYVGVNVTPAQRLHVVESTATSCAQFAITATSALSSQLLTLDKADNNTTTSNRFVLFRINNSTGSGSITANGAGAATFTSTSDARLKENIVDLPTQLSKIKSLRPVEFDYKDGSGHQIGFIAQEVEQIYPDLVGQADDGFLTLSDLNKNDARLIKAIQELAAKVEALEAKVG